MAKVLGLGGIFFKSSNPESLAKWYQKWLHMEMAYPYGANFKKETLPAYGYQVWAPFKQESDYFSPGNQTYMFNLIVDDLDSILAQLKPSGCLIMPEIERGEYGSFGWFVDPEGNKVELWQPPEKAPVES